MQNPRHPKVRIVNVGAGSLAIAVCQINIFQLTHRYREQAPSHKKQKKQNKQNKQNKQKKQTYRVCKTRP
ncbi:hypothetical protein [Pseudomonas sp. ICMP 460]|uniref:hypothetical protein n=1 Tax=Pseudomonas sp. ICMP 460 TaxID=1718917 RepID=UPI000C08917E|nr:hypothetical protein [Pseudomonas sp. ICMP 460]PHN18574.1 hypothetical protein AO240_23880 [Pseudomonas sp. ICMP 460]